MSRANIEMKEGAWNRLAGWLADRIQRRSFAILLVGLLLAGISLWYAVRHLEFWTERSALLSTKSPSALRYKAYREEVPDDYLILILESREPQAGKRFASRLGEHLQEDTVCVRDVFYRIPPDSFRRQALLFLSPEELRNLYARISTHKDTLHEIARQQEVYALLKAVDKRVWSTIGTGFVDRVFASGQGEDEKGDTETSVSSEGLLFLSSLMDSLYSWIFDKGVYDSPWDYLVSGSENISEDGYFVDKEKGWTFVFVYLKDMEERFNREGTALQRIRAHIRDVSRDIPDVKVGVTGTPALNSEEMESSLKDMTRAIWLAFALITAIFLLGFAQVKRPLMAILALAMGVLWTLGWTSLTVGHLTILSMAFGSILIGLGIDFGIHMIARYEHEARGSVEPEEILRTGLQKTGRAVLGGGLTTAAAFLALGLSRFLGIREFGWIAGWGILFCLTAGLIVLPALLLVSDRRKATRREGRSESNTSMARFERFLGAPARLPSLTLPAAVILTLLSLPSWTKVRFDYNLLHLQPKGTEATDWERRLIEAQGNSSIFAVDMVDSLEEARRRSEAYEALPLVSRVESLATYLPDDMEARLEEIRRLRSLFLDLRMLNPGRRAEPSLQKVSRKLSSIRFALVAVQSEQGGGLLSEEARPSGVPPPNTLQGAAFRVARLHHALKGVSALLITPVLAAYQKELFTDFRAKIQILIEALDPVPITIEELPAFLKKRLQGISGKYILQIYPREDVWDSEAQKRFVGQLREVCTDVTGPAVANYESTKALLDAYLQGGLFALIVILGILFLDFRRPFLILLALTPLVLAALWTGLGMRLFGITFNPANLVIIPLLVGIGVDNGIHVVRHFLSADSPDAEIAGSSTGRAITLSTLTTMAGFGSLMVARHQGIFSIGALLTIAMASSLLASLVVLPSLLRVLPPARRESLWRRSRPSSTLTSS